MNRKMWFALGGIFMFFAMCIILADVLYFNPKDQELSPYEYDKIMGWLPKRDFSRNFTQKDAAGSKYNAFLTYDHHRFRAYGDPATKKTKILFLGDSFTGDAFSGNSDMYFSVVKAALRNKYGKEAEIFAAGGGGYGTLQEYLLVKEQIKIIRPDIFVLQFSDNDFGNNLMEWEHREIVRNQNFYRPYYSIKTGELYYSSSPCAGSYKFLYNNSYFFRRLDIIFQRLQFKYYNGYSKKLPPVEKDTLQANAYQVTGKILRLMQQQFDKDAKLFIMIDLTDDNQMNSLQVSVAKESGFTPLLFPMQQLNEFEAKNKTAVLRHADGGHLNILGNKILGENLAAELSKHMD